MCGKGEQRSEAVAQPQIGNTTHLASSAAGPHPWARPAKAKAGSRAAAPARVEVDVAAVARPSVAGAAVGRGLASVPGAAAVGRGPASVAGVD